MLAFNLRLFSLVRPNNLRPILFSATATNQGVCKQQKAGICHKSKLSLDGRKPPYRFPYEKMPYNLLTALWDPVCRNKLNENSKIIIIEGNVASGKGEFGKKLAEELDMKFMAQPDLDEIYINSYGFDYRSLNPLLPEHLRTCDLDMFHDQPNRHSVIHMQHYMQLLRAYQYLDALAHLLNTGQGVILERSPFTEKVFVEAMHKMGWLPIGYSRQDGCEFYDWRYRYNYVRMLFCRTMPAPHLTIYLDVPPEECHRRIKDGSDKVQANSNALSLKYLETMDDYYQREILQIADTFGHLLRYDNTKGMDEHKIQDIVDDIENLDFTLDHHDTRFDNWQYEDYKFWFADWRMITTSQKELYLRFFNIAYFDIAGLGDIITQADLNLRDSVRENHVVGWNRQKYADWRHNSIFKIFFELGEFEDTRKRKFFPDFS